MKKIVLGNMLWFLINISILYNLLIPNGAYIELTKYVLEFATVFHVLISVFLVPFVILFGFMVRNLGLFKDFGVLDDLLSKSKEYRKKEIDKSRFLKTFSLFKKVANILIATAAFVMLGEKLLGFLIILNNSLAIVVDSLHMFLGKIAAEDSAEVSYEE